MSTEDPAHGACQITLPGMVGLRRSITSRQALHVITPESSTKTTVVPEMSGKRTRDDESSNNFLIKALVPTCLVCASVFSHHPLHKHAPVQSSECGHTFCRSCVLDCHASEVQSRSGIKTVPCLVCRQKRGELGITEPWYFL
jgi:RING-type zinc-finger